MGRANRTVLLVDDAEPFRRSLRRLLEHDGHRVICAADGREALAKLEAAAHRVDAVLLDLAMPVMDGFACLEALRDGPFKETPVVVLTADERRGSLERAEALGARHCLHKGSTLFDQLSRYLRTLERTSAALEDE
jgi:CheY-like chemotaxis protein